MDDSLSSEFHIIRSLNRTTGCLAHLHGRTCSHRLTVLHFQKTDVVSSLQVFSVSILVISGRTAVAQEQSLHSHLTITSGEVGARTRFPFFFSARTPLTFSELLQKWTS